MKKKKKNKEENREAQVFMCHKQWTLRDPVQPSQANKPNDGTNFKQYESQAYQQQCHQQQQQWRQQQKKSLLMLRLRFV